MPSQLAAHWTLDPGVTFLNHVSLDDFERLARVPRDLAGHTS